MTDINLAYGAILAEDAVYEILPKMLENMSLFEKKAIYAGHYYDPEFFRSKVEAVNSDSPEFMVTDFGEMEIMDVLMAYIRKNYTYLSGSPFQDEEKFAVCLRSTRQGVQYYGEFEPEKFNNIPDEEKAELEKFISDMGLDLSPQPIIWTQYH